MARWRAGFVLASFAVFALSLHILHGTAVSANKSKAGASATNDSSAASDQGDMKPAKGKAKAKKARPEKGKKKGKADNSQDATGGSSTSASGNGTGGFVPPASGSGSSSSTSSGGNSSSTNSGKGSDGSTPSQPPSNPPQTRSGPAGGAKGGGGGGNGNAPPPQQGPNPDLVKKVMDIQNRNQANLLSQKGVAGVGTGVDDDGNVVIRVLITGADDPQIPDTIENVPVVQKLTGPIHPLQIPGPPLRQTRMFRPTPIGVSAIDDTGLCATGTLGCRLRDNHGNFYGLSNNHVFANENSGIVGVDVAVQPGPLDDLCQTGITTDIIGTLTAFVPLNFTATGTNTVDCAIISTTQQLINTSTLSDGYGVPRSSTVKAFLTQKVQKYGRTTGFTTGTVTTLNLAFPIAYTPGTANFVGQIEITPDPQFPAFSIPGDSGSLVVDQNRNPVALLFAGNGFTTDCNPIDDVLTKLAAQLILNPGVPPDTTLTIDDSPPTPIGKEGRTTPDSP